MADIYTVIIPLVYINTGVSRDITGNTVLINAAAIVLDMTLFVIQ